MNNFTKHISVLVGSAFISFGALATPVESVTVTAARYEAAASAAEQKAQLHENMARTSTFSTLGTRPAGSRAMTQHCERLAQQLREEAEQHRSAAAALL